MKPAIRIENLSKCYRIGTGHGRSYRTLRESIMDAAGAPWRRLRRLARGKETTTSDLVWALRQVSLEIQPGEVVGIIGRNGAGKSTLLKVLSRVTEPTAGRIEVRGRLGSLLEVGTGFHFELTGRENVFLNGAILGMTRREIARKFDDIVAFAEIEKFLDTPVKRYSSGMKVRLAFAVAAHLDPHILLLDEVLAVGDMAFQKKCIDKTRDIVRSGRTVLLVSHNMATVLQVCQEAILLHEGRLIMQGTAAEVSERYLASQTDIQPQVLDLSQVQRGLINDRHAQLLSCKAVTPDKADDWSLLYGSMLELDVEVRVHARLAQLTVGVVFCTATGAEIGNSVSCDGVSLPALSAGRYLFHLSFPGLMLKPGRYFLGLYLHCEHGFPDNIPEAAYFDILPTVESTEKGIHGRHGPVIPACRCTLAELPDAPTVPRDQESTAR